MRSGFKGNTNRGLGQVCLSFPRFPNSRKQTIAPQAPKLCSWRRESEQKGSPIAWFAKGSSIFQSEASVNVVGFFMAPFSLSRFHVIRKPFLAMV